MRVLVDEFQARNTGTRKALELFDEVGLPYFTIHGPDVAWHWDEKCYGKLRGGEDPAKVFHTHHHFKYLRRS